MKKLIVAILLILVGLIPAGCVGASAKTKDQPIIVIRIDDIQDFAWRDAQSFLLNESMINKVPLSLAVISGSFGEDSSMVQEVKLAISLGSELGAHGWMHEDLTEYSLAQQSALLFQAKIRLKNILNYDTILMIPPMYRYNQDTIDAMYQRGYTLISPSTTGYLKPGNTSKVTNIPSTVELSTLSSQGGNDVWTMKSLDAIKAEIANSIQNYGFAVITTHPQEFVLNSNSDELNPTRTGFYHTLVQSLQQDYTFDTLEGLSHYWKQ